MTPGFIVPSDRAPAGSLQENILDTHLMNSSTYTCSLDQTALLLAQLAAEAVGASDYCLLDDRQPSGLAESSSVRYPIRVVGCQAATLVFEFRETEITEENRVLLNQMAAAIEAVLALPHSAVRLAVRIARLDAELADIKIRERTRGLLEEGVAPTDAIATVLQHVEHVLERRPLDTVFAQLLPDLEERVAERKLLMKAKTVLQEKRGMSEEQAYLHLRIRSRSSRKRLREVAQEVISQSTIENLRQPPEDNQARTPKGARSRGDHPGDSALTILHGVVSEN